MTASTVLLTIKMQIAARVQKLDELIADIDLNLSSISAAEVTVQQSHRYALLAGKYELLMLANTLDAELSTIL